MTMGIGPSVAFLDFIGSGVGSANPHKQDNIPVGCVPPACQPYVFRWLSLDVSPVWGGSYTYSHGYTYTPLRYLHLGIPTSWKGPGTRDTLPFRNDIGPEIPPPDLVPETPTPPQRDMVPEIPTPSL